MGYLDDIIIYSRSKKEHLEHLEEIFTRLKAAGLKLKLEKCCFFKKTHTVSWTLNFGRWNLTQNQKNSKPSPKICGYFTSANTPNQKSCGIQMDT